MNRQKIEKLLLVNYNKTNKEIIGVLPNEVMPGADNEYLFPVEQIEAELCLKREKITMASIFSTVVDRVVFDIPTIAEEGSNTKEDRSKLYTVRNGFVKKKGQKYSVQVFRDNLPTSDDGYGYETHYVKATDAEQRAMFDYGTTNEAAALVIVAEKIAKWETEHYGKH